MRHALVLIAALLTGCAADPQALRAAAVAENSRLAPPSKPLSSFGHFELAPMELSDAVRADDGKVEEARDLEQRLRAKLLPLLSEWSKSDSSAPALRIVPKVFGLRVVSGTARFWVGGLAGNSSIDMNLTLIDVATNATIADPRIQRESNALAGGYSMGATDQNLLDYIVAIAYEYLESHH